MNCFFLVRKNVYELFITRFFHWNTWVNENLWPHHNCAYLRDAESRHRDGDFLVSRHACTSFHSSSANCKIMRVILAVLSSSFLFTSIKRQLLLVWSCRWGRSFLYEIVRCKTRLWGVEAQSSEFNILFLLRVLFTTLGYKIFNFRKININVLNQISKIVQNTKSVICQWNVSPFDWQLIFSCRILW